MRSEWGSKSGSSEWEESEVVRAEVVSEKWSKSGNRQCWVEWEIKAWIYGKN